ncbi:Putative 10 TMS drug/metabolite exporter, DME family, DMT superfamily (modular protein) [Candidatus Sulfotelmatobacter kueseliae]|uniref:10 TMS drug/metabolite exporter, DME family, DMT superfamily (Modular protein) n=1 Tax=Candidatus Sulfotelmatobacter kueseliae TaxID=2042962 RepID=A0A2U3KF46_9BACT|nr:Putative 10 TMS drug/metabolite exporter, DME family, DMT superfamily (modular protein) [Candidatus Sulfotelmatobacter kueseliae]
MMFFHQPAQILARIRSGRDQKTKEKRMPAREISTAEKMINIGGRPVIVPTRSQIPAAHRAETIKLALAFAAICVIWGSTYLAIRYAVETIPPLVTAGIRHSIAGGILLAWAWARGFRPRREHWISGFVLGALFFLIGHGSLHWAEQYVGSGLAALLIATEPMFILVLAWATSQQRISRISALGLGLGVVGVALLTRAELTTKGSSLLGLLAVLVSSLAWSAGVVISPKLKLPTDALGRTALPTICGAAMLLIAAGLTGEFRATHWASISLKSALGLAYLIVFGSVVAFTAYMWLLQRCPPALVATHTYANPVVAVLLGWLLASEPLTMRVVFSSVAILGAIVLIRRGERTATAIGSEATGLPAEAELRPAIRRVS